MRDFTPTREIALYRKASPVLKALIQSLEPFLSYFPEPQRWKTAILASALLEKERDEEHKKALASPKKISPASGMVLTHNGINFLVAKYLGVRFYQGLGINHVCSSGNTLLGVARRWIAEGETEIALVISINSMASILRTAYHQRLGIISKIGKIRPFHRERDGTIMADGIAVALVASERVTRFMGWEPWALILAEGERADSYQMYGLDPEGEALQLCIEEAISKASLLPEDIEIVRAHATGTQQNDSMEAGALKRVFSRKSPLVTALKPIFGHTVTSSALLETLYLIESMRERKEVPNIKNTSPSNVAPEARELSLVLKSPAPISRGKVLSLAAGFGGFYSATVLEVL